MLAATMTLVETKKIGLFPIDAAWTDQSEILEPTVRKIKIHRPPLWHKRTQKEHPPLNQDHVLEYAKESLTMDLLLLEFKNAMREDDGDWVLWCWKYFLYFRETGHMNYLELTKPVATTIYFHLGTQNNYVKWNWLIYTVHLG